MKILSIYKSIGVVALAATLLVSCSELEFDIPVEQEVALTTGSLDFSNYVAVGASFTAGVSDNGLFIASQTNSWPNTLASQFSAAGGGDFSQPYVADNYGGLLYGGTLIYPPRLYFNGSGPAVLPDVTPTTDVTNVAVGPFNNLGVPGAKSYHLLAPGYGDLAGVPLGTANPYFARMASSSSVTLLEEAVSQNPTFFTLSEMGGNDVLSYSTSGGVGTDQTGNPDVTTYSSVDITDPGVFTASVTAAVAALTANGAKGCLTTVPYVTSLPFFTTVPYNAVPLDAATAGLLNGGFAEYNGGLQLAGSLGLLTSEEIAARTIVFVAGQNAVTLVDEDLTDLSALGLPSYRQATPDDLLVLPSSSFIGTLVDNNPTLINGVSVPLSDQWVLTGTETQACITAADAYNLSVDAICDQYDLAKVDLRTILEEASQTGIMYDDFMMNTDLVFGGLVSLDGVHFTARGYALMANAFLEAIDAKYGSNFIEAGQRAYANNFPVSYPLNL